MDKKQLNRIMITVSLLLLAAGIIFLCISLFGEHEGTSFLSYALGSILLSNLFNLIRIQGKNGR